MHNEELQNLHSLPNIIRTIRSKRMRWVGHVVRKMEKRNACKVLVGKQEGKRQLGIPRRRWENNIKTDFGGTRWGGMEWINLAQDRGQWRALVNTVMNLRVS
jgi:hypothetical protein